MQLMNLKKKTCMEKQYVSLLAVLLSFGVFCSSCNNKVNENTGSLKFEHKQINEKMHLFGDTAKPSCNLIIKYTYPVKSSDRKLLDSLNNLFVADFYGREYVGEKLDYILKDYAETYTGEYRRDLEPMYFDDWKNAEDKATVDSWYSYYQNMESRIQWYEGNLLTYRVDINEYTGGAHREYRSHFLNIDLSTIRLLKLDDLFKAGYAESLPGLLWEQLMADKKVSSRKELEDMGYGLTNDLTPAENFYMDHEGITFYYNIYEFTPYMLGPLEIKLPYAKLEGLLSDHPVIKQLRQ